MKDCRKSTKFHNNGAAKTLALYEEEIRRAYISSMFPFRGENLLFRFISAFPFSSFSVVPRVRLLVLKARDPHDVEIPKRLRNAQEYSENIAVDPSAISADQHLCMERSLHYAKAN
jgi:hypothetical protein